MKLIVRAKYRWNEPVGYYRILRKLIRRHTPMWRFLLGNAIIFLGPAFVVATISYYFKKSVGVALNAALISFFLFGLLNIVSWYVTRTVYVLDENIACQESNKYRYWNYSDIANVHIERLQDEFSPYEVLVLTLNQGQNASFILSAKIDKQALLAFIHSQVSRVRT